VADLDRFYLSLTAGGATGFWGSMIPTTASDPIVTTVQRSAVKSIFLRAQPPGPQKAATPLSLSAISASRR